MQGSLYDTRLQGTGVTEALGWVPYLMTMKKMETTTCIPLMQECKNQTEQ